MTTEPETEATVMSPEEFAAKLRGLDNRNGPEECHEEADKLLCRVLKSLGYGVGIAIFEEEMKYWWYS